jgi:hypothetical protein
MGKLIKNKKGNVENWKNLGKVCFVKILAFMIIFLFISSYAFANPVVGKDESLIVVKRKSVLTAAAVTLHIFLDGQLRLSLKNGEQGQFSVSNGEHSILGFFNRNYPGKGEEIGFSADSQQITFEAEPRGVFNSYTNLTKINEAYIGKGIYVGVVSFGSNAEDLTGGMPIYLNGPGYNSIQSILDTNYIKTSQQGTALYYAIHKALANLTVNSGKILTDMASVGLITFTDGLDNNSTSLGLSPIESQNFAGRQIREYSSYIKSQIESRKIFNKNITAFSIGVPGNDVNDVSVFSSSLQGLANNGDNVYNISNIVDLNNKFASIADQLVAMTTNMTFTVSTPSYPVGTKIRMTFDVSGDVNDSNSAEKSNRYLQGDVSINNGQYVLTNIRYSGGISALSGNNISGRLNGTEVSYIFPDFQGYNGRTDTVKQWSQEKGSVSWQINSEYKLGESIKANMEEKSLVIYLVLDSSNSLSQDDIIAIREATKNFVRTLYNKIN